IQGGLLWPRVEKVLVGRRDCTQLVDGMLKQVELVRDLVDDVPVTGVLCFVEADWPLIGGPFTTREVHVLWPRRLAKILADGRDGHVEVAATRESTRLNGEGLVQAWMDVESGALGQMIGSMRKVRARGRSLAGAASPR
ncbi:MAG: hypothetical protein ACRDVZ_02180, partial [Jiangellaceae bacterium]